MVDSLTDHRASGLNIPQDLTKQIAFLSELQSRYPLPVLDDVRKAILLYPYDAQDFIIVCEKLVWVGEFFREVSFHSSIEGLLRVRSEIEKRESLHKNLLRLSEGHLSFRDMKAVLSGMVRVIVEFEHEDDYQGSYPILEKILSILLSSLRTGLSTESKTLLDFIFIGGRNG